MVDERAGLKCRIAVGFLSKKFKGIDYSVFEQKVCDILGPTEKMSDEELIPVLNEAVRQVTREYAMTLPAKKRGRKKAAASESNA